MSIENVMKRYEDQKPDILSRKEESLVARVEGPDGSPRIIRVYHKEMPAYQALENHSCPGLPKIYGCSREQDCFVVEEEWIDGICIQEILEGGGTLEPQRALAIMEEVSKTLGYLHSKGFIHRDVKAEHVMLTAEGNVFLIDLDAAMRIRQEKKNDTQLLGTTGYAAPEQFGLVRSDARTDIYAMGILLNTVLTGQHPTVELYRKEPAAKIITKCTALSPADRYQNMKELETALSEAYLTTLNRSNSDEVETVEKTDKFKKSEGASHTSLGKEAGSRDEQQTFEKASKPKKAGSSEKGGNKSFAKKAGAGVLICALIAAGAYFLPGMLPDDGTDIQTSDGMQSSQDSQQDGRKRNADGSLALPEGYEQLYVEPNGEDATTYYTFRQGSRNAPLGTGSIMIDDTYEVHVDENVGQIDGYDEDWGAWILSSRKCEVGEQGFFYAEKGDKKYAIQVLTMGEPISAYTKIPDLQNMKDGYLKPGDDMYLPEERVVRLKYKAGEPVKLYLVAMYRFDNLVPTCDSDLVTIQLDESQTQWPWHVFNMTFDNPDGGDVTVRVPNQDTSLTFVFEEE